MDDSLSYEGAIAAFIQQNVDFGQLSQSILDECCCATKGYIGDRLASIALTDVDGGICGSCPMNHGVMVFRAELNRTFSCEVAVGSSVLTAEAGVAQSFLI